MIHVDVDVPAIEKTYEFSLNENVKVSAVIDEIAHVVAQNEQRSWNGQMDKFLLCNCSDDCILPANRTLYECDVQDGFRLMLI